MKPSIVLLTVGFGLLVAGTIFWLGYRLLDLSLRHSLIVAGGLGTVQSAGGLYYIWRRFKYQGGPPPGGGHH